MTATATSVTRELDASGDSIKGFADGAARIVQAVAFDPEVGAGVLNRFTSPGAAGVVSILVDASARFFYRAWVTTIVGAADPAWLMVFDKATAPVAGDDPIDRARVGGGFASIDLGEFGYELADGLGLALSRTIDKLTLAGANDAFFTAGWV